MKDKLIGMKRLLVIVDMVKGFRMEGPMAVPGLEDLDMRIFDTAKCFIEKGDDVISIQEGHDDSSIEFKYYPEHCKLGTSEAELIDVLEPLKDKMYVIRKNSTSGYIKEEYQEYLKQNKKEIKQVVVCGLLQDICVFNLALPTKMFFNENNIDCDVVVPLDLTDTFDSPDHSKEEYKILSKKMLNLNGIRTPEKLEEE